MKKVIVATLIAFPMMVTAQPEGGSDLFEALDSNADQAVSAEEAKAYEPIVAQFETLDINKDGQLSRDEFSAFLKG